MPNKPVILIVDDSPTMAQINQNAVESFGKYTVVVRENSTRAISYVGNNKVDLILMDIELADSKYDGIETARLIMSKYFIPIVFVTSIDNPDVFRRANLSGFFDVIIKPYDNKMLLMHIEIALQNNRTESNYRNIDSLFDSYISSADTGIFITDSNGKIIKMNNRAEEISDYSRSLTIGKNILDILPLSIDDGNSGQFLLGFDELINNIGSKQFILRQDGRMLRLSISYQTIQSRGNSQSFVISVR